MPLFSIIIPTHNSSNNIETTIASIRVQTFGDWEAFVIDDGSTDVTLSKVEELRRNEPRIRLLQRLHSGVSVTRNAGIAAAKSPWLIFLDSDDSLQSDHLQKMVDAIRLTPSGDLFYCGWQKVTPTGGLIARKASPNLIDPFAATARYCPFTIHAAVVRRASVSAVGGFDPTLSICEDWDLWQRLARVGCKFISVTDLEVIYTIRPLSASNDCLELYRQGRLVIDRGHAADPRISLPARDYATGRPRSEKCLMLAYFASWVVGLSIGQNKDFLLIRNDMEKGPLIEVDPKTLAAKIFDGFLQGSAHALPLFKDFWSQLSTPAEVFLSVLECRSTVDRLMRRTLRHLERLACDAIAPDFPATFGALHCLYIPVERSAEHIYVPPGVERLRCLITSNGKKISRYEFIATEFVDAEITEVISKMQARAINKTPPKSRTSLSPPSNKGTGSHWSSYWDEIFREPDPWDYSNAYEQLKYAQTLMALPVKPIDRALELACAEGHFTRLLAHRVKHLTAADISKIALARAALRCEGLNNVTFMQLDLVKDEIPGGFDLIVCSEVLYYLADRKALMAVAERLADRLNDGGLLLMTHAHLLVDDPESTGFDWPHPFGAKTISVIFAAVPYLELCSEQRSPLYRISLFRKSNLKEKVRTEISQIKTASDLPPAVAKQIRWSTGLPRARSLPILMYHRIAQDGPSQLARYRVSPDRFAEQICYLSSNGYTAISLGDLYAALWKGETIPDKSVMITFDDGYADTLRTAWPVLENYGFTATVFIVTGAVGTSSRWDSVFGTPAPLMSWEELRLLKQFGISIASHGSSHLSLTGLRPHELLEDLNQSLSNLRDQLGDEVRALAYPYGEHDEPVAWAAYHAGYQLGFTCECRLYNSGDKVMLLPRIEIAGSDDICSFAQKIAGRLTFAV